MGMKNKKRINECKRILKSHKFQDIFPAKSNQEYDFYCYKYRKQYFIEVKYIDIVHQSAVITLHTTQFKRLLKRRNVKFLFIANYLNKKKIIKFHNFNNILKLIHQHHHRFNKKHKTKKEIKW